MPSRANRLVAVGAVYKAVQRAMRPGGPTLGERASAVPRLAKAVASGDYVGLSKGRLALMLAAAGYIASPVDLLPEGIFGLLGLADDAMVLGWLATQLVEETESFLEWERSVGRTPRGEAPASPGSSTAPGSSSAAGAPRPERPASSSTVRGDVVP
ncbi:DUF1232 domain-containing protein [Oryzobacter telluris]|uniref:DUF1232 domain-containing protein n=1 Tax=Oryzobacter telluris TaxID=3149179 RepID=UPI00370D55FD